MPTHQDYEFDSDVDSGYFTPDDERDDDSGPVAVGSRIIVDLAAFACELGMLALLAVAGWGLGSGGLMGIALATFYPALVILIWSVWIAPKASHRLGDPWRLIVQAALFGATGVALGAADHLVFAIVFPVMATLTFTATRLIARPSDAP